MVRVFWEQEGGAGEWTTGQVEKITAKTVEIYYEESDTVSRHYKTIWSIERLNSAGEIAV